MSGEKKRRKKKKRRQKYTTTIRVHSQPVESIPSCLIFKSGMLFMINQIFECLCFVVLHCKKLGSIKSNYMFINNIKHYYWILKCLHNNLGAASDLIWALHPLHPLHPHTFHPLHRLCPLLPLLLRLCLSISLLNYMDQNNQRHYSYNQY